MIHKQVTLQDKTRDSGTPIYLKNDQDATPPQSCSARLKKPSQLSLKRESTNQVTQEYEKIMKTRQLVMNNKIENIIKSSRVSTPNSAQTLEGLDELNSTHKKLHWQVITKKSLLIVMNLAIALNSHSVIHKH